MQKALTYGYFFAKNSPQPTLYLFFENVMFCYVFVRGLGKLFFLTYNLSNSWGLLPRTEEMPLLPC